MAGKNFEVEWRQGGKTRSRKVASATAARRAAREILTNSRSRVRKVWITDLRPHSDEVCVMRDGKFKCHERGYED